ncbi:MAG: hypothetical protein HZA88_25155 [Verrucomicrobia bacterium]|nr:hypothetical protein [Verrucomicrobiota bacterium]
MKKLLMLMVAAGVVLSASAQSPVQVTVQRTSKKKSEQGEVRRGSRTRIFPHNTADASMTLRITLQNISGRSIEDMVVRWGIAKVRLRRGGQTGDVAYGRDEKCSLKSNEIKVIETETVEASSSESQLTDFKKGEKIHGHGVQLLIGGKVLWEEFVPPTVKKSFENLRPLSDQEKDEDHGKSKKKK